MKKIITMAAVMLLTAFSLSSCLSDDDEPKTINMLIADGIYITNSGTEAGQDNGSLTFFDYADASTMQNLYRMKNSQGLGTGITDAVVCGSKLYIVGGEKQVVYVTDKKSVAKVAEISTQGMTPSHIDYYGGYVYVSTDKNKVLAIDTVSNSITKTYDCGNASKGICAIGRYVITADSNDGNEGGSVTVIDVTNGESKSYKNENIVNPVKVLSYIDSSNALHIYHINAGVINDKNELTGQGIYELDGAGKSHKMNDGVMGVISDSGILYSISNLNSVPTYTMTDLYSAKSKQFINGTAIDYPTAIAYDPTTATVIITSLRKVDGAISHDTPGYAVLFDSTGGTNNKKIETGINPTAICFRTKVEKFNLK